MPSYLLSVIRSAIGIMLSRLFGLVRDIVVAAVFGASAITDMFFVAYTIPNICRQFVSEGALVSSFVPFLSKKIHNEDMNTANRYITQLILIQTIVVILIIILFIVFAKLLILFSTPGYKDDVELIDIGISMLRILMPFLFFISISGVFIGYLNVFSAYFVGYASSAILNIAMIAGAVGAYFYDKNIYLLTTSVVFGGAIQAAVLYLFARRKGFRLIYSKEIDNDIIKTGKLILPYTLGIGVNQINFFIGRIAASYLAAGSISWLFYAQRVVQLPLSLFSTSISTIGLTEFSKAVANNDKKRLDEIVDKSLVSLYLLVLPATIGLYSLAYDIIHIIFARNAFTDLAVLNTSQALKMYTLGLMFSSASMVLIRIFNAKKDAKTPLRVSIICFFIDLIAILLFIGPFKHSGVALASSLAAIINTVLLYFSAKDYKFNFKNNYTTLLKVTVSAIIMYLFILVGKYYGLNVLVIITICALVYFASLTLLGIKIKEVFK